jgi:ATP adenylyltransferase
MVVPYEHTSALEALSPEVAGELFALTQRAVRALKRVYQPHGLNVGMNLGECAGAGIADHLHMHVLPRWPGDANFMTAIGETRVIPEELGETWRKLKAAFDAAGAGAAPAGQ